MPDLRLDAVDAFELAELLQFPAGPRPRTARRLAGRLRRIPRLRHRATAPGAAPVHVPARRRRR